MVICNLGLVSENVIICRVGSAAKMHLFPASQRGRERANLLLSLSLARAVAAAAAAHRVQICGANSAGGRRRLRANGRANEENRCREARRALKCQSRKMCALAVAKIVGRAHSKAQC